MNAETMRAELGELIQESNVDRKLDSLETVVILIYLRDRMPGHVEELERARTSTEERPTTIEEWVAWAAKHSVAS